MSLLRFSSFITLSLLLRELKTRDVKRLFAARLNNVPLLSTGFDQGGDDFVILVVLTLLT